MDKKMRTFDQLSVELQQEALDHFASDLVNDIAAGCIRFNDQLNQDDLQRRIDDVIAKAKKQRTPWFIVAEMLLHDHYVKEHIYSMAQCDAEDTLYPEKNESSPRYYRLSDSL